MRGQGSDRTGRPLSGRRGWGAWRRRAARLLLGFAALVPAVAPPGTRPAAAEDLPQGDAALVYQIRHTRTGDEALSPSSATEHDLGLVAAQEIPNYGFLRAEAHLFDATGESGALGWAQVALTDLRVRGAVVTAALGDSVVDARLLPRRFLVLVDPTFDVEGAQVVAEAGATRVALFGGRAVDRVGSFATDVERSDQTVTGVRVAQRLGGRAALTAMYLHADDDGTVAGGRVPAGNDSLGLGADVPLYGPLALLAEVRYTADPNGPGPGRTDGWSYAVGPLVERRGLRAEATAFSLDPSYLPVEGAISTADRRGLYAGFSWDAHETVGFFGSALRSRNNLAGDPTFATVETTQLVGGGRLFVPVRWPVTAVARLEATDLDALATTAGEVDSTTTSLLAEVSQVIGAWRPLLRTRWSHLDDRAIDQGSTTVDLTAELWWQVTRRARLWAALEWTDVRATVGLADATRHLARVGGEQRVSSALFLRGEAELSTVEEAGTDTTRAGVNASVGYRHRLFDLYLDLRHNWTDQSSGGADYTDDVAYLRVTVPFRWGRPTPPPVGRRPGEEAAGWGSIRGEVFVDADGDGRRGPDEAGLEGLRVVLDGLPGATATTDRDGRYGFARVAAGPHTVRLEVRRLPADLDLVTPQLVEVTVVHRGTAAVDFAVQPLGRIEGRLRRPIAREGGEAVEGTEVGSIPVFLRRGDEILQTYSEPDGAYAFDNVRAGDYDVLPDAAGLREGARVEPPSRRVTLGVGATARDVDFLVLEPARPEIRNGGGAPGHPAATVPPPGPASRRPADRSRDCFGDSPEPGMIGFFRFPFDSGELIGTADQAAEFQQWARWLAADPRRRLVIEGHTDPVGDDPYNFGLAGRRATAVFERLVAAGAPPGRMRMVAEGPDLPCDPGDGEHAWARNRRALIMVEVE